MRRSTLTPSTLRTLAALADVADGPGASSEAVLGASRFDGSCNNTQETVIIEAERFGRRIVNTPAFQQCIQRAVAGFTFTYPNGAQRRIGP